MRETSEVRQGITGKDRTFYPSTKVKLVEGFQLRYLLSILLTSMSIGGYKVRNQAGMYFVTFAVVEWVDVFTRKEYRDLLLSSLRYCQQEKGMKLRSLCIMSNHVHLIFSARNNNVSELLRDFKKYTSRQIVEAIERNEQESRREWMLEIFKRCGAENSRNTQYQFWRQDNQPKELYSPTFSVQKLEYIHQNPVTAGIVEKAEEYVYSSARDYHYGKKVGLLEVEWL